MRIVRTMITPATGRGAARLWSISTQVATPSPLSRLSCHRCDPSLRICRKITGRRGHSRSPQSPSLSFIMGSNKPSRAIGIGPRSKVMIRKGVEHDMVIRFKPNRQSSSQENRSTLINPPSLPQNTLHTDRTVNEDLRPPIRSRHSLGKRQFHRIPRTSYLSKIVQEHMGLKKPYPLTTTVQNVPVPSTLRDLQLPQAMTRYLELLQKPYQNC
jgi:hypothetical protein